MADTYLSKKNKELLKKVAAADSRSMNGEVEFLLKARADELKINYVTDEEAA